MKRIATVLRTRIRTHYSGDNNVFQNLGDAINPYILNGLGFECVSYRIGDDQVLNPGRCLLGIGSLLSSDMLRNLSLPLDVWGTGWRGKDSAFFDRSDIRFHAVRGPLTAEGFDLPPKQPMGDPALLMPLLFSRRVEPHKQSILIPHIYRVSSLLAMQRASAAGCSKIVFPLVYARLSLATLKSIDLKGTLTDAWNWRGYNQAGIHSVWQLIDIISGASFVLTGALHGAILAQAYGVPWAAYNDGYLDVPPKWADWGAYLGIKLSFVKTLKQGHEWWNDTGRHGQTQSVRPLLNAFPYINASPKAQVIASRIRD